MRRKASERGSLLRSRDKKQQNHHNVSFAKALLLGLVKRIPVPLPEDVGEDNILNFLSIEDTLNVRATSSQLKAWAEMSLLRRETFILEGISNKSCNGAEFVRMLNLCRSVRRLAVVSCESVSFKGIHFGWTPSLQRSLRKNLVHICIRNSPMLAPVVPDGGGRAISPIVPLLMECHSLEILDSDALCDDALEVVGSVAGKTLRSINLRDSTAQVSGNGIVSLVGDCDYVEHLDLSGCNISDIDLQMMTRFRCVSRGLRRLDISNNHNLTEEGVASAIEPLRALSSLSCCGLFASGLLFETLADRHHSIRYREVGETIRRTRKETGTLPTELYFGDCPHISSLEGFSRMLKTCGPSLHVFELTGCKEMSDITGFCDIPKYCFNLKSLILSGCAGVTDIFLMALSSNCENLEKLVLRRCPGISDVGIGRLVKSCPQLSYLDLSGCTQLSNKSLQHFATCSFLEHLSLSCCSKMDDEGILAALRSNKSGFCKLSSLDISWCFRISSTCILALLKRACGMAEMCVEGLEHFTEVDFTQLRSVANRLTFTDIHTEIEEHGEEFYGTEKVGNHKPLSMRFRSSTANLSPRRSGSSQPSSPQSNTSSQPKLGKLTRKNSTRKVLLHQPSGPASLTRRHTISSPAEVLSDCNAERRKNRGSFESKEMVFTAVSPRKQRLEKRKVIQKTVPKPVLEKRLSLNDLEELENKQNLHPNRNSFGKATFPETQEPWSCALSPRITEGTYKYRPKSRSLSAVESQHRSMRRFGDRETDIERLNAFASAVVWHSV